MTTAPPTSRNSIYTVCFVLLLFVYLAAEFYAAFYKLSPAQDEPSHVRSGLTMLTGSRYVDVQHAWWSHLDALHPPTDMLAGLAALAIGESPDFRTHNQPSFRAVRAGRCVNILLGLLTLSLVYFWVLKIWSPQAASFALLAVLAQPLFFAHAGIVSSDLAMAFGGLLATFALWKWWLDSTSWLHASPSKFLRITGLLMLALLIAILCKVSNIYFLIAQGVLAVIAIWRERKTADFLRVVGRVMGSLALSSALALLLAAVIWEAISPPRPPIQISGRSILLPFGHAFLTSLHTAGAIQRLIATPVYFLQFHQPTWKLYAFAAELKTPWPLLIVWISLPFLLVPRFGMFSVRQRIWTGYLLALALGMALLFTTRGIYLGLRHLLLPLVLMGLVSAVWAELLLQHTGKWPMFVIMLFSLLLIVINITVYPWQLSYFNFSRFLPEPLPFVDSDSDWGQGLLVLRDWQQQHPNETLWLAYFGNARPEDFSIRYRGLLSPYGYVLPDPELDKGRTPRALSGYVAISATQLAGSMMHAVQQPPNYYEAWRRERPIALLGGSIYLFDRTQASPVPRSGQTANNTLSSGTLSH